MTHGPVSAWPVLGPTRRSQGDVEALVRCQVTDELLTRPGHPGADGPDRAADRLGGVGVGEAQQLGEDEGLAPVGIELLEQRLQGDLALVVGSHRRHRRKGLAAPSLPGSDVVGHHPAHNGEEPGTHRSVPTEGTERMQHPDEAVLGQVVGTVDVTEMGTQPPHVTLGGADELLDRPRIPAVARGQREDGQRVVLGHGRDRSRTLARVTGAALLLGVLLGGMAMPAYAATFTGYVTKVTAVTPDVPEVTVKATLNGEGITVTNTSDQTVIVDGYQGEPYAKITKDGIWQNDLSPAVYLNKEQTIGNIPTDANASQTPKWTQISTNHRFQWHDHRIHWMGAAEPPVVAKDPGKPHQISTWKIPMTVGDTKGDISGTLSYVPGSHWGKYLPYVAIAVGVIVVVLVQVFVVRRRRPRDPQAPVTSA